MGGLPIPLDKTWGVSTGPLSESRVSKKKVLLLSLTVVVAIEVVLPMDGRIGSLSLPLLSETSGPWELDISLGLLRDHELRSVGRVLLGFRIPSMILRKNGRRQAVELDISPKPDSMADQIASQYPLSDYYRLVCQLA